MPKRNFELLRPLIDIRIHFIVIALPLFEWWVFRKLMMSTWTSPSQWASLADLGLRWGGHEFLFVLTVFAAAAFAVPGGAARFLGASLVPLGVVAIARAYVFLPWGLTAPADGMGSAAWERFLALGNVRFNAMFLLDPLLAICMVATEWRHLLKEGRRFPSVKAVSWPGITFAALLCVSSTLRPILTRTSSGGPFGFDIWMMDGPDVPVLSGAVWPHGRQLLQSVLGAWVTVLPAVLLTRWLALRAETPSRGASDVAQ